jgi:TonB family protein
MRAGTLSIISALFLASVAIRPEQISAQSGTADSATTHTSTLPSGSVAGGTAAGADSATQPKHVGGDVSSPTILSKVDPHYSEAARKANVSGTVLVNLCIDEQGNPSDVHVSRGVGMGLDENAVEAVKQYKFKPAMENGKPVLVEINIEISFRLNSKQPAAYESDPKFLAAMADGKKLNETNEINFAIDAYKKANKIAGGKCADCLQHVAELQMKMGSFKDAAATAAELAGIADNPVDKSEAEFLEGQALYSQGGEKPKPAQLQAADQVLKAAIADYPKNLSARFCEGAVLARLGQTDAAREQFEACVAQASPNDPAYLRAKHFAANPAISYAKMAPAFTVTALDGTNFTLDAMGGRVVLIDFWATWCGPCNEEVPHMKKIAKEFAGQPLVIISVSWDSDEKKWRDFIAKNQMTWMQYRDADHELTKRFGVEAIPHYFTIDSDGVLTSEMMGEGSDVEGKLRKLMAKARAAQAVTTVSATSLATATFGN